MSSSLTAADILWRTGIDTEIGFSKKRQCSGYVGEESMFATRRGGEPKMAREWEERSSFRDGDGSRGRNFARRQWCSCWRSAVRISTERFCYVMIAGILQLSWDCSVVLFNRWNKLSSSSKFWTIPCRYGGCGRSKLGALHWRKGRLQTSPSGALEQGR